MTDERQRHRKCRGSVAAGRGRKQNCQEQQPEGSLLTQDRRQGHPNADGQQGRAGRRGIAKPKHVEIGPRFPGRVRHRHAPPPLRSDRWFRDSIMAWRQPPDEAAAPAWPQFSRRPAEWSGSPLLRDGFRPGCPPNLWAGSPPAARRGRWTILAGESTIHGPWGPARRLAALP